jgi:hypothetical protein
METLLTMSSKTLFWEEINLKPVLLLAGLFCFRGLFDMLSDFNIVRFDVGCSSGT